MEKNKIGPLYALVIVAAAIFFVEFIIMFVLPFIPTLSPIESVVIDSIALVCFVFPALYFFLYRPQQVLFVQLEHAYREKLESKNKYETVVNSSPDCIKLFNTDKEIIFENHKSLHKMCRTSEDGQQNCDYINSIVEDDQVKFTQALSDALLGKTSIIEIRHILGFPKEVCMEIVVPLKDSVGKTIGVFGVSRDVTAYKKLERIKESLMQMIVHDLNNPLAVVSGEAQLLGMELKDMLTQEQQKAFRRVTYGVGEIKSMVENLLDISLMEENRLIVKKKEIDSGVLVEKTVNLMNYVAETEGKSVIAVGESALPVMFADEEIVVRIISNLIRNALKFSAEHSCVEVRVVFDKDKGEFVFSVKDQGMGIPKEYLERIFEKYVRVENKQVKGIAGKGLGLTFCKMAVESHNGKIWVESEPGKGSIFYFTLPVK